MRSEDMKALQYFAVFMLTLEAFLFTYLAYDFIRSIATEDLWSTSAQVYQYTVSIIVSGAVFSVMVRKVRA